MLHPYPLLPSVTPSSPCAPGGASILQYTHPSQYSRRASTAHPPFPPCFLFASPHAPSTAPAKLPTSQHSACMQHNSSFPPFFLQVGYKVPWTAISSLLHQFNQQFQQPKVLLWLNLAYFLPSIPALLLHSSLQDVLEQRLGVPKAAVAR